MLYQLSYRLLLFFFLLLLLLLVCYVLCVVGREFRWPIHPMYSLRSRLYLWNPGIPLFERHSNSILYLLVLIFFPMQSIIKTAQNGCFQVQYYFFESACNKKISSSFFDISNIDRNLDDKIKGLQYSPRYSAFKIVRWPDIVRFRSKSQNTHYID